MITLLLNQTCTLYAPTIGDNGRPEYSTGTSNVPCRFETRAKRLVDDKGELYLADGVLFLGPDVTIARNYKVTVSGIDYRVERVDPCWGLSSLHHYECTVKELT